MQSPVKYAQILAEYPDQENKFDAKMNDFAYLSQLMADMDRRANDIGYTIEWTTFVEFTSKCIKAIAGDNSITENIMKRYSDYINKKVAFILELERQHETMKSSGKIKL